MNYITTENFLIVLKIALILFVAGFSLLLGAIFLASSFKFTLNTGLGLITYTNVKFSELYCQNNLLKKLAEESIKTSMQNGLLERAAKTNRRAKLESELVAVYDNTRRSIWNPIQSMDYRE